MTFLERLIPVEKIMRVLHGRPLDPNDTDLVEELAGAFLVSTDLMRERLKSLPATVPFTYHQTRN